MFFFFILFSAISSWAKFDLTMGLQGRTLPALGAEVYGEAGYGQLLWGRKETPKDFLYGLLRPSLAVSSSGVINSAKAELELFPISFMGISVGRQYVHSNYDFPFLDCSKMTCEGEFVRNWVESKMALGFKGWVVVGNYKVDTLRAPESERPMADWRHVIVGEGGEEVQIEKKLLLAKSFGKHLAGVLAENVQFLGSRERKESYAAIYQFRRNDTNYMVGAGTLRTSQQPLGFVLYFRIHHLMLPSLKLF